MKRCAIGVLVVIALVPHAAAGQSMPADSAGVMTYSWAPRVQQRTCPMPVFQSDGGAAPMPSFRPKDGVHYHIRVFTADCENPLAPPEAAPRAFTFATPSPKLQVLPDTAMRWLFRQPRDSAAAPTKGRR